MLTEKRFCLKLTKLSFSFKCLSHKCQNKNTQGKEYKKKLAVVFDKQNLFKSKM